MSRIVLFIDTEIDWRLPGAEVGGHWGMTANGYGVYWGDKKCSNISAGGCTTK